MKEIKIPITTADEMFEELGFNKWDFNYRINYGYNDIGSTTEIIFLKDIETYKYENLDLGINKDLHLAIHQKLIELGGG